MIGLAATSFIDTREATTNSLAEDVDQFSWATEPAQRNLVRIWFWRKNLWKPLKDKLERERDKIMMDGGGSATDFILFYFYFFSIFGFKKK